MTDNKFVIMGLGAKRPKGAVGSESSELARCGSQHSSGHRPDHVAVVMGNHMYAKMTQNYTHTLYQCHSPIFNMFLALP